MIDIEECKVDKNQLKMGIKIEMEHTKSKRVAKIIAMQHLCEYPKYYTSLKRMEKCLSKRKRTMMKRYR